MVSVRNIYLKFTIILLLTILTLSVQVGCGPISEVTEAERILREYVITECSENVTGCTSEELVVSELIKKSEPFAKFYAAERGRMPAHIHWIEVPAYSKREAATDPFKNETKIRKIPPDLDDAYVVAHELNAYIYFDDGFPAVGPSSSLDDLKISDIAMRISDICSTPIRDKGLEKYGFDLETEYEMREQNYLSVNRKPDDEYEIFVLIQCNILMRIYWEDILERTGESEYNKEWESRYPELKAIKDTIFDKIREIGHDTPQQVESVCNYTPEQVVIVCKAMIISYSFISRIPLDSVQKMFSIYYKPE